MQVILLEVVEKLGAVGDVVDVKPGYARNFLLLKGKALRATQANLEYFRSKQAEIEARNHKSKAAAEIAAAKMDGASVVIVRNASDSGYLYGSVRPADIIAELAQQGHIVEKSQIRLQAPIRSIGNHNVGVVLFPGVIANIVARVCTAAERSGEETSTTSEQDAEGAIQ
ncbi:MAG: 50S ribosomal protein L9 [Holosporales bacterium]|jgi:large subunit ribosomal protein L9|nr:50S ribosomal protein L9 [Holosporales bacterium]